MDYPKLDDALKIHTVANPALRDANLNLNGFGAAVKNIR